MTTYDSTLRSYISAADLKAAKAAYDAGNYAGAWAVLAKHA